MSNITNYIKFDDCKEGFVYKIYARNFQYAIFYKNKFYGVRYKFSDVFIDGEIHWDKDEMYGTVKPLIELNVIPDNIYRALKYNINKPYSNNTRTAHEVAKGILIGYLDCIKSEFEK